MKKLFIVFAIIACGLVFFSFKQQTNEKNIVIIRIYETCKGCGAASKIIISGDGAEKVTPIEKWDVKNPESNTNLEVIRYALRQYNDQGYKIATSTAFVSGYQEITTYVLIKE